MCENATKPYLICEDGNMSYENYKILILEDNQFDAELLLIELKKIFKQYEHVILESVGGFTETVKSFQPDIILSDYNLGPENGLEVIKIAKEICPQIPVIIVTGALSEEVAVNCIHHGAWDYIIKDKLFKLEPAIKRSFEVQKEIIQKEEYEQELKTTIQKLAASEEKLKANQEKLEESEYRIRSILNNSPFPVAVVDKDNESILFWSKSAIDLFEHKPKTAKEWYELAYPDSKYRSEVVDRWKHFLEKAKETGEPLNTGEYKITCKDGSVRVCELYAQFITGNLIVTLNDVTNQKQAERNLIKGERRLSIATKAAGVGIWDWDIEQNSMFWDKRIFDLYGIVEIPNELTYEFWQSCLHPDDRVVAEEAVSKALKGENTYDIEFRVVWHDGSIRWIKADGVVLRNDNGDPIYMIGTNYDITKRIQADIDIKRNERDLRSLVENPVGYVIYRTRLNRDNGQIEVIQVSPSFMEVLGVKEEDSHMFEKWFSYVNREDLPAMLKANEDGMKPPYKLSIELRYNHPQKGLRWLDIRSNGIPYEDDPNMIEYANGMILDITERKLAEEEAKQKEKLYKEIITLAPVGYYQTTNEGDFILANDAFAQILGFSSIDELMQMNESAIYYDESEREELLKKLSLSCSNGIQNTEIRFKKKTGEPIWVLLTSKIQRDPLKGTAYYESFIVDISEIKDAQNRIKQDLDERNVLIKELYHRTKNNMQIIISLLYMIEEQFQNDDLKRVVNDIKFKVKSMALVHQKLYQSNDLSRINLKEYIYELADQILLSYSSKMNKVNIEYDMNDTFVLLDVATPLGLIINELITNSFKHAWPDRRTGKLMISLLDEDDSISISIADDGVGLKNGFDLNKGSKLGLNLVNMLGSHQLDGKLSFENQNGLKWTLQFKKDIYKARV